ncbi:MAG TPA: histone deacetylase family protein [Geminicoccaceae bacterium]|jgi:acetoin utilization deacetylase AcuC-like enzyme|nr:histone deacetylase family protein [Geminicoccaceae bacterium]
MTTLLYTHPSSLEHDTGPGHPESPARMRALMAMLEREERKGALVGVERREPPRATREQLERVHTSRYVDAMLDAVPESGHVRLDPDTVMSPGSGEAGLRAAGAAVAAVDAVIGAEADNAFCALRPPGHHAEAERAMGFCLFNNVAIGARQALDLHGIERISIFDFDVHHGNGTQHTFEREPRVQYLSTHQWPLYPGTGARDETGVGNIVNRPLPAGTGSAEWRRVVEADILPAIDAFAPELIMISAGFDAHRADPLAMLELIEDDYRWVTAGLVNLARRHASGRVVSVLEGGYDLTALANSALAHLNALRES